jgi:capsular polysaccharide transport system permease protein
MSDGEKRRLSLLASLESQVNGSLQARRPRAQASAPSETTEGQDQPIPIRDRQHRQERLNARRASQGSRQEPTSGEVVHVRAEAPTIAPAIAPPLPSLREREEYAPMPSLPVRTRKRSRGTIFSFFLFVVFPVIVVSIYYIAIASNQYVTEFKFAVRDSSTATSVATSTLTSLLGGPAAANPTDNYMVADYLVSRQIVDELQSKINVTKLYNRPSIDWWSRYDASKPIEKFVSYWQNMVYSNYDFVTGIATVRVRAFTPEDAYLISTTMVSLSERLINEIAMRPKLNAVKYAEEEVKRAEDRLKDIRAQMTSYRNKESVIEPNSSVVASNTTLAQTLRAALVQYETELGTLTKQHMRANSPYMQVLRSRINSTREQLAAVEAQVANAKEGNQPLSNVVGDYEKLNLEVQFAQTILTSTVQSLEQARANAMAQSLYVTPFVRPSRPESSTYPNRIESILTAGMICLFLWVIGLLTVRSIGEHLA